MTGTIDANNPAAIAAAANLVTAYDDAFAEPFTVNLTGQDLGGLVLGPGVYHFDSSAQLTGTLILDGQGSTNPTFIFQMGSTITTASASHVQLINGAADVPCSGRLEAPPRWARPRTSRARSWR